MVNFIPFNRPPQTAAAHTRATRTTLDARLDSLQGLRLTSPGHLGRRTQRHLPHAPVLSLSSRLRTYSMTGKCNIQVKDQV